MIFPPGMRNFLRFVYLKHKIFFGLIHRFLFCTGSPAKRGDGEIKKYVKRGGEKSSENRIEKSFVLNVNKIHVNSNWFRVFPLGFVSKKKIAKT